MSRSSCNVKAAFRKILQIMVPLALILAVFYGVALVMDAIKLDVLRVWQLRLDGFAMQLLPRTFAGIYVFPLPTGGVLRGDYLIVVIIAIAAARGARRMARSTR